MIPSFEALVQAQHSKFLRVYIVCRYMYCWLPWPVTLSNRFNNGNGSSYRTKLVCRSSSENCTAAFTKKMAEYVEDRKTSRQHRRRLKDEVLLGFRFWVRIQHQNRIKPWNAHRFQHASETQSGALDYAFSLSISPKIGDGCAQSNR